MPDLPLDLTASPPTVTGTTPSAPFVAQLPDQTGGALVFPPDGGGPYYAFGLLVVINWDSGLSCAPPSGRPDAEQVFWRVSAASSEKVVSFVAARIGDVPQLPHYESGSDNDVLMNVSYSLPTPVSLPDGTGVIAVGGTYLYKQRKAIPPSAPLLIPNSALGLTDVIQIDPALFSRLLVPATAPPGFSGGKIEY